MQVIGATLHGAPDSQTRDCRVSKSRAVATGSSRGRCCALWRCAEQGRARSDSRWPGAVRLNRARRSLRSRRPRNVRTDQSMLDQLRQQIQTYLDELLGEADLRRALAALGSRDGAAPPSTGATPSAARDRAGRRAHSDPASRTATREAARPRPSTSTATPTASAEPAEPPAKRPPRAAPRTAPGATKTAVLQALRRRRADRRPGRDRDRTRPRDGQHHTLKARQKRRGDKGRSRLPARRPAHPRHANRRRRQRREAARRVGPRYQRVSSVQASPGPAGPTPDPRTGVSARRSLLSQLPSSATQHQGAQQWPPGP
jgi:hypothetical protein